VQPAPAQLLRHDAVFVDAAVHEIRDDGGEHQRKDHVVVELTRDYDVILPLMLATVVADLVYSSVNEDSIMTEKLRRRGLHVGRHYEVDPFSQVRIGEIMTTEVEVLSASATVGDARSRFAQGGHGAYPVVDNGELVGIIARGDVLRVECDDADPLLEVASRQVVTLQETDSAQTALRLMLDEAVEHLPVVDGGQLVGICTRTDLLKVRRRRFDLERQQPGLAARLWSRHNRESQPFGR